MSISIEYVNGRIIQAYMNMYRDSSDI